MNLDDVAAALAEAIDTIDGLRASSEVPQLVNPPVAVVGLGAGTFETLDTLTAVQFGILLLLSTGDAKRAQKALRGYVASIKAAVDSADLTLAGTSVGASSVVRGWDAPAVVTLADADYIGLEFHVEVIE